MVNQDEISRALRLWFQPGDVFEVRVLDAVTADYRREHVESGYFDYNHIGDVADALKRLLSYRGVYVTVNPVKPDLLARAVNRLRVAGKNPTSSDSDIACRRWLLIDCDAERPSGVSSSDSEHEAALAKAQEIRNGLSSLGWAEPIMTDSGNGAQLMYRIKLPSCDDGLVQKVIAEIAKCGDDKVKIDLTVHNPARIWRLPGTMNCKGDSIPSRPHRMAKLHSESQDIGTISIEQLQDIVVNSNVAEESVSERRSEFDIGSWIRQYCPELGAAQPWKGGRRWIFPVCPFNEAHNNKSAVLIEQPSGAIAFACHHNGCSGNDWQTLRELKEPGCYDPSHEDFHVNIDGILNQSKSSKPEKEEPLFTNPGTLPEQLLHIPGLVEDITQVSMTSAPYPNRVLAFSAALSFLAFLVGRKVQDKRDNRSNIYLIALADSSTGKDHPRKVNFNLAFRANVASCIADEFVSGAGLEDALFMSPSMLFQVDEFDTIFNMLKLNKDAQAESILQKLLKFYGASNSIYPIRKKAMIKPRNPHDNNKAKHIVNPSLVIFGTAIPHYFYESLNRRVLENGLFARCIIIEAGDRGTGVLPKPITPSDSLLRAINYLVNLDLGGNLSHENPRPLIITETPDATARLMELQSLCDERYMHYQKRNSTSAMAVWGRVHEKICKLALLYSISENVYNPAISVNGVNWAYKFIEHLTTRMLFMADSYVYENVFDEKCQKVVRHLRQAGGSMQHSLLLKRSKDSLHDFKHIIETLSANGTLESYTVQSKTKSSVHYRLL